MAATPPPKNSLLQSFLNLPPRQRIQISAGLMAVSLFGLYVTDNVEKALLEKQAREQEGDKMVIDTIDRDRGGSSRGMGMVESVDEVKTRGSSTDRTRL